MKLGHVLQSTLKVNVELGRFSADELKRAARFWLGKEAGSYNKDRCIAALTQVLNDGDSASRVQTAFSEKEREVLALFTRYGPTVSGGVLTAEMHARGLGPSKESASDRFYSPYRPWRADDVIGGLRGKLVLIGDSYYSDYHPHGYPRLSLHGALLKTVEPAAPLAWTPSGACDEPARAEHRSSAEVALDLWRVASALRTRGTWTTVKGDSPSKQLRAWLRKSVGLGDKAEDPMSTRDPESLFYELLHGMGLMNFADQGSWIRDKALARHLEQPPEVQAWHWVRAWLHMALWQDGIGVVPDRDSDYEFIRIQPQQLSRARELLVWALARVAHSSNGWLALEGFLRDLWQATREAPIEFWAGTYAWDPGFEMARKKEQYPAGENRLLAFWLADEGVWAANAVMVTLVTLGLVERGETRGRKTRPCFRLTELGRAVFGAPEIEPVPKAGKARFLAVQPNLEIVAYLESADASQICTLARFAGVSRATGPVRTFALRRESLYAALESGMTLDEVRRFLSEHGKTELPANVDQMLSEWARRRESLVLRKKAALALGPAQPGARGRALSPNVRLLPSVSAKTAVTSFAGWAILDHEGKPERTWTTDELGSLTIHGAHSISQMRLARIADRTATGWQITQASLARARTGGLTADQILGWLGGHLTAAPPALLEVAVRNWTGRQQGVSLGAVHLLEIVEPRAKNALLHSPTFRPLLAGHIPPDWFLIREDSLSEVRRLLERLGFTIGDSHNPQPLGAVENPASELEKQVPMFDGVLTALAKVDHSPRAGRNRKASFLSKAARKRIAAAQKARWAKLPRLTE